MYLKQLEIHGFKTFAEKTQIVFTPGITCVIGPNGSGKSNIADAILWVLGENNVRSLRGNSAQDVIFAGNERRRPLGMAEVSLTIDNTARILPLEFAEITVTRRVYRSGEGEYFINRTACRLRDIYELFLDTGVGRDAYSLVNQGEIDQILSVRAEDRRAIFEEAAGIKKYRVRRREAERKLEHTQQNLLRVSDIIGEIESRLGPLQRQAAAARRYRELAVRLSGLENAWYGARLRRLDGERASLSGLVAELRDEGCRLDGEQRAAREAETAAIEELRRLDERAELLRRAEAGALQRGAAAEAERARAEERAGEVQRRLRDLARDLEELASGIGDQVGRSEQAAREEAALKHEVDSLRQVLARAQAEAGERGGALAQAARELERLRGEWLERARRRADLDARVEGLEARLDGLGEECRRAAEVREDVEAEAERLAAERASFLRAAAEQGARAEELRAALEELNRTVGERERALGAARSREKDAERARESGAARRRALAELGERGEGAAAGARRLLDAARTGKLAGDWRLLAESLEVPDGLERAVAAGLGIYGDALLCESAAAAAEGLRVAAAAGSSVICLPGLPPSADEPLPGSLALALDDPAAAAGSAGRGPAAAWARALLGRAALCERIETASGTGEARPVSAASSAPGLELWVTPDGSWLTPAGAMGGGPAGAGEAELLILRRREMDRLEAAAPALEECAAAAREEARAAETALRAAQSEAREKQGLLERARLEHQSHRREADRRGGDEGRARQRLERQQAEEQRARQELSAARDALERLRADRAAAGTDDGEGEPAEVRGAREGVSLREKELRDADRTVTDLRVRLAQQEQRLHAASAAARRILEAGASLDRQRTERLREQGALNAERDQRRLSFGTLAQEAADAEAEVRRLRGQLEEVAAERTGAARRLEAARVRTQETAGRLRELLDRQHRAEVELTAVETQQKHLGQQWMDAAVSGHSLEAAGQDEVDEPLALTVEALMKTWDAAAAERILRECPDAEADIGRLRRQIRALGAVNPDAVEQFAEASERYEFLSSQRADLESAREQIEGAIGEIDAASRETFLRAFREIAAAFDEMFRKLFGGGTTELRLTDESDVLETGIDIIVQPPGKKQQNLLLLSGGERALTAAAMLFALLKVRPSPFCVLDEVDAPLDETNVGRFSELLGEFAQRTQFILVTHNRGTMERADTIYGVTMEERGISQVLSCSLADPVVARVEAEQRPLVPAQG